MVQPLASTLNGCAEASAPPAFAVILAALTEAHRIELARVRALLILYRETLEAHGIEPPDKSGQVALERFRHAFLMAGEADTLQHPELLHEWVMA